VLGEEATGVKSNEITAIPRLLECLELQGALVAIDTLRSRNAIAGKIVARSGDYCLALKANRPLLDAEV
jgi:predicted transposase YbfD/YdcC